MTAKIIRFAKRATKQHPFYSLVQLFCYFGAPKDKAFNYAVVILESLRFWDRLKRKAILKRLAPPKVVISSQTAAARTNADKVEGLNVLRQATLAIIGRNRGIIEENRETMIAQCRERKTSPNLDLLRIRYKDGWHEMENLEDFREVFAALAHPDLFSIAAHYLGGAPVLMSVAIVFTPQNDSILGSQVFHAHHSFD